MRTYKSGQRLAALISFALLLSASLLAARAADNDKVFLPLALHQIAPLRIDSAASTSHTDASGNLWLADTGFVGGTAGNFGNIAIANTTDPLIYQTERYQLTGYALPVANGPYSVTLHFAENFQTAAGKRIFSVNVEGTSINNLDVFAAAGGEHIALRETVGITVTDGLLNIGFTPSVGDVMIDGLEVIAK